MKSQVVLWSFLITALAPVATLGQAPAIAKGGVLNAADGSTAIAPGTLVSIYGMSLAPGTKVAPSIPLPSSLNGVSVEVQDGSKVSNAPLWFVSAGQINALMPFGVGSAVNLRVRTAGGDSAWAPVTIVSRAPRLFTKTMDGKGEPLVFHSDYTAVSAAAPAKAGEYLFCYANGLGAVDPEITSGAGGGDDSAAAPLNRVTDDMTILIGSMAVKPVFAGLAPYFVGVYQLNFQVPDTPGGSLVSFTVRTEKAESQAGISMAYSGTWQSLANAAATVSGVTLSASGVSVTAAAGVLAAGDTLRVYRAQSATDPTQMSELYAIDGISTQPSAAVEVRLDFKQPPNPTASYMMLLQEQGAHGPVIRFVQAQVQGSQAVANLGPSGSLLPRNSAVVWAGESSASRSLILAAIVTDPGYRLSTKGKFRMRVPEWSNQAQATIGQELLDALDNAYDYLEEKVGMSWSRRTVPYIEVQVYAFGKLPFYYFYENDDMWGYQESPKSGPDSYFLGLNLNKVYDGTNTLTSAVPTMKLTAAHELFHLAQTLCDPRDNSEVGSSGGPWYWMHEAASTWLEKMLSPDLNYIPATVEPRQGSLQSSDNYSAFLKHGLAYPGGAGGKPAQEHGYGASLFLHHLADRNGGPGFVGRLLALEAGPLSKPPKPAVSPVEALQQLVPDLSAQWRSFISSYMAGTVYPGGPQFPTPDLLGRGNESGHGSITQPADSLTPSSVSFMVGAQDLSARSYSVTVANQPPAGSKIQVEVAGGADAEAIVYRTGRTTFDRIPGSALSNAPLSFDATQLQSQDSLTVMVPNGRAVKPYDQLTNITLTVGYEQPLLAWLQKTRGFKLVFRGSLCFKYVDPTFSLFGQEFCRANDFEIQNTPYSGWSGSPPLTWTGTHFEAKGRATVMGSSSGTYDIDVEGDLDSMGKTVKHARLRVITLSGQAMSKFWDIEIFDYPSEFGELTCTNCSASYQPRLPLDLTQKIKINAWTEYTVSNGQNRESFRFSRFQAINSTWFTLGRP